MVWYTKKIIGTTKGVASLTCNKLAKNKYRVTLDNVYEFDGWYKTPEGQRLCIVRNDHNKKCIITLTEGENRNHDGNSDYLYESINVVQIVRLPVG
jgi:hypothetical protein